MEIKGVELVVTSRKGELVEMMGGIVVDDASAAELRGIVDADHIKLEMCFVVTKTELLNEAERRWNFDVVMSGRPKFESVAKEE